MWYTLAHCATTLAELAKMKSAIVLSAYTLVCVTAESISPVHPDCAELFLRSLSSTGARDCLTIGPPKNLAADADLGISQRNAPFRVTNAIT